MCSVFSYITDTFRALFKYARAAASPVFDVKNDTAVEYKEYTYNADTRLPVTCVDSFVFKVDGILRTDMDTAQTALASIRKMNAVSDLDIP